MMSLACDRVQDLLPEYAAGGLDATHRAAIAAHLELCADCAAESDVVATVATALPSIPAGLEARVLAAAAARPARRRWGTPAQLAAAATIAAAAIGGSLLFQNVGNRSEGVQTTSPAAVTVGPTLPAVEDPTLSGSSVLADLTEAELEALLERMES